MDIHSSDIPAIILAISTLITSLASVVASLRNSNKLNSLRDTADKAEAGIHDAKQKVATLQSDVTDIKTVVQNGNAKPH